MSGKRIPMLDILRGGAMVLVVAYHLLYNLVFVVGLSLPVWLTPGKPFVETVHIAFLWVLFAVSGICSGYSHNLLRRGVWLYIVGFAVTLVTTLWIPEFQIVFGVLSCFGACMVITALCDKVFDLIPWLLLTVLGLILWLIFADFSNGVLHFGITDVKIAFPNVEYLYPLGVINDKFFSVDYFPVIPYVFMFVAGRGLYRPISNEKFPKWFYTCRCHPLEWIGRHSLIIYAVHQPILIAIVSLIW